jgi:hypothetical protein
MGLIDRAKNIIITPKTEWDVIAAETTPTPALITGYVLPLVGAAALAGFIGSAFLLGMFGGALGIGAALVGAVIHVVMAIVSVFVIGFIVDVLAPTFSGQKNMSQALKVAAYSYTPAWVFGLAAIIPFLGWLGALIGGIYGIYLLYLGLPKLMKSPEEKTVPYLVVVILCAIVLWFVIAALTMCVGMGGAIGTGLLGQRAASEAVQRGAASAKLDEFGKKMEEASKRMEAAQKSGDPNKQMEAAMGALGTALSGGKGVEPVQLDQLKPFVPEKFAGLPRTDIKTERSGVAGFTVARVEGRYGDSAGKDVELEVTDTGGMAGLMGLASWVGIQGEREDANHREVTRRDGNRVVHEEVDKRGGHNEYTVVLAERFVVSAKGSADIGTLKSGVASLDLGKLETLK